MCQLHAIEETAQLRAQLEVAELENSRISTALHHVGLGLCHYLFQSLQLTIEGVLSPHGGKYVFHLFGPFIMVVHVCLLDF